MHRFLIYCANIVMLQGLVFSVVNGMEELRSSQKIVPVPLKQLLKTQNVGNYIRKINLYIAGVAHQELYSLTGIYDLIELKKIGGKTHIILDASHNNIQSIPRELLEMYTIIELSLNNNQLTKIPHDIAQLAYLQVLNIDNNQLTELPYTLFFLENLRELSIANNKISELPHSLNNLKQLTKLTAHHNTLEQIPPTIVGCDKLTHCDVSHNNLTNLSILFFRPLSLTELDLRGNTKLNGAAALYKKTPSIPILMPDKKN